jgi:7,8-dihydro-6-hydroxymethylpterin-pyrophosphokinase
LFYGNEVVKIGEKGDEEVDGVGWLEVPHWGIAEREFVLRPLNEWVDFFISDHEGRMLYRRVLVDQ